jgi:hypothetical protein
VITHKDLQAAGFREYPVSKAVNGEADRAFSLRVRDTEGKTLYFVTVREYDFSAYVNKSMMSAAAAENVRFGASTRLY